MWWRSDRAAAVTLLLAAAAMRLSRLHAVPPGLAQDEVLNADIHESIWQGNITLFFREGWGHEPLYHYYAALFQPLLGDNVLSIRLPAAFLGLVAVALLWRWAHRFGGTLPALVAAGGLALDWWPIVFSRIGIRPGLEVVLLLAMALTWRRRPVWAGVWLGLVAYTYTPGVLLLPLPFVAALLAERRWRGAPAAPAWPFPAVEPNPRAAWRTGAVAVALYLPLALFLWRNPDLLARAGQLRGPIDALFAGDVRPLWGTVAATLSVFSGGGDPRWTYMWPAQSIVAPPILVGIWLGLGVCAWRLRSPTARFLLLWLGLALVPSMVTPDAPNAIRLIGAVPVLYLLPGLAAGAVWRVAAARAPGSRLLRPAGTGLLVVAAAVTGWRTVDVYFNRWPAQFETRLKYQTTLAEIAADAKTDGRVPVVATGFYAPIDDDSLRRNMGRDPAARWVQAGQAVVWPDAPAVLYVPEATPLDPALAALLPAAPLRVSATAPGFAAYALDPPSGGGSPLARFGSALTLLEATVGAPSADGVAVLTRWRVDAPLPADAAIFLHATAPDGTIATQDDRLDAVAATLRPGDTFVQRLWLRTPDDPSTPFALSLGVYQRSTGVRFPYGSPAKDVFPLADAVRFTVDSSEDD